ncbi:MAG: T9SS type A sorting domain-containing protein, partial [Flavobacterium sp.]
STLAGASTVDILFSTNVNGDETKMSSTLAGASTVDILFSTNVNGDETTFTTIASGLPNNGTAAVTIPSTNINFSACRFMVKASGNIFFAVNSRNFAISANLTVNDFEFQNFTLYPNPSNGNFIIQFEDPSVNELKINIVDIRGRKIYENKFTNQTVFRENIQLKEAEAGVYLVIVSDGNRKMVKRIIVE